MTTEGEPLTPVDEVEVRRRVKEMREDELVDFVRETVVRLDALADRLEVFAQSEKDSGGNRRA